MKINVKYPILKSIIAWQSENVNLSACKVIIWCILRQNQKRCISLQVLQGDNVDAPEHGRYCGNGIPPAITSTGYALTIVFSSDASVQQPGFTASYSKSTSCEFGFNVGVSALMCLTLYICINFISRSSLEDMYDHALMKNSK